MSQLQSSLLRAVVVLCLAPAWLAAPQNLLTNPSFDTNLSGWGPPPGENAAFLYVPGVGSPSAGSALGNSAASAPNAAHLGQCVPVTPGVSYTWGGAFLPEPLGGLGQRWVEVWWYSGPNCASGLLYGNDTAGVRGALSWYTVAAYFAAPPNAQSAFVEAVVSPASDAGPVQGYFDSAYMLPNVKGDLDHNGSADLYLKAILTQLPLSVQHSVWLMNGLDQLSAVTLTPNAASGDGGLRGVGDFNRDGQLDLVFHEPSTGQLRVWLMNGTARIGSPLAVANAPSVPLTWQLEAVGARSGSNDLVWLDTATSKLKVWRLFAAANAPYFPSYYDATTPSPDHAADANWSIVAAVDFNLDGHSDFLWYNETSGKIVLWFMDGNYVRLSGGFTNPPNAGNNNWKVRAASDFGVGPGGVPNTNDILWNNATTGKLVVWYMDAAGNRTSGAFTNPDHVGLLSSVVGPK